MARSIRQVVAIFMASVALAACGDPTKEDIVRKSDGVDTKQQLEKVLGRPSDIAKLGPVETWTYNAANGSVSFVIAGDRVTMSTTADKKAAP